MRVAVPLEEIDESGTNVIDAGHLGSSHWASHVGSGVRKDVGLNRAARQYVCRHARTGAAKGVTLLLAAAPGAVHRPVPGLAA